MASYCHDLWPVAHGAAHGPLTGDRWPVGCGLSAFWSIDLGAWGLKPRVCRGLMASPAVQSRWYASWRCNSAIRHALSSAHVYVAAACSYMQLHGAAIYSHIPLSRSICPHLHSAARNIHPQSHSAAETSTHRHIPLPGTSAHSHIPLPGTSIQTACAGRFAGRNRTTVGGARTQPRVCPCVPARACRHIRARARLCAHSCRCVRAGQVGPVGVTRYAPTSSTHWWSPSSWPTWRAPPGG